MDVYMRLVRHVIERASDYQKLGYDYDDMPGYKDTLYLLKQLYKPKIYGVKIWDFATFPCCVDSRLVIDVITHYFSLKNDDEREKSREAAQAAVEYLERDHAFYIDSLPDN